MGFRELQWLTLIVNISVLYFRKLITLNIVNNVIVVTSLTTLLMN